MGSPSEKLLQLAPVLQASSLAPAAAGSVSCESCSSDATLLPFQQILPAENIGNTSSAGCCNSQSAESVGCDNSISFKNRLFKETLSATWMVGKFMALAFILEALITFYVPASWITGSLGSQSPLAVFYAALLGVPAYHQFNGAADDQRPAESGHEPGRGPRLFDCRTNHDPAGYGGRLAAGNSPRI